MPTVIDELVTILGLESAPGVKATLDKFNAGLDKVTRFAGWAGAALTAASASMAYFVERTTQAAGELEKFRLLTGISTNTLQGWMYAAERAGGSADSLQQDLMGLTKSMSSPIPGEFNHALFMLGVNLRKSNGELKSADEILLNVADKFQGMSKVRQIQWASRIGISDDTLLLLQQGRGAIDAYMQQAKDIPTIVNEKNLRMAREFTIQMTLLRRIVTYLSQTAASAAGPILSRIVKDVQDLLAANKEFIQMGLRNFIEGVILGFRRIWEMITSLKESVYSFLPGLKGLADALFSVETISQAVYVILFTLAVILTMLVGEWVAIAAAIALGIAALEDVIIYFQGGESAIGKLIEKVKELSAQFSEKFPNISWLAGKVWDILKKLGSWTASALVNTLKTIWDIIKNIASVLEKIIGSTFSGIDKLINFLRDFNIGKLDKIDAFVLEKLFGFAPATATSNAAGNTTNQQNVQITQHINGNNAPAVADEVALKTNNALRDMYPGSMDLLMQ